MNDKTLMRHLCARCTFTYKIGTLITNYLEARKILICRKAKEIKGSESEDVLKLVISKSLRYT